MCTGKNPELWKEKKDFQITSSEEDKNSEIQKYDLFTD